MSGGTDQWQEHDVVKLRAQDHASEDEGILCYQDDSEAKRLEDLLEISGGTDQWQEHDVDKLRAQDESLGTKECKSSADELSLDSHSITSQSDVRSYREKLRHRIQNVKEKASSSLLTGVQHVNRARLRDHIPRPILPYTNELLSLEEAEIQKALEKHEKSRNKWKKTAEFPQEIFSSQIAFDFFSKVWINEDDEGTDVSYEHQIISTPPKEEDILPSSENGEHVKLMTADYLGLEKQDDGVIVDTYIAPDNDDSFERVEKEKQLFCFISTDPAPLPDKLDGTAPRFIEEEGLFKPLRPIVSQKNLNKLENRILLSKNKKWFGEDGEPIRLPDPIRKVSFRLPMSAEVDNLFTVQHQPAASFKVGKKFTSGILDLEDEENYVLEIELTQILFTHHWLFSREHVLACRLNSIYEKYKSTHFSGHCRRLHSRLQALRMSKDNTEKILITENDSELANLHSQRLKRYKIEIQETRERYLLEMKTERNLLTMLLSTWRDLKQLRENQGYVITTPKLIISQHDDDSKLQEKNWEYEMDRTVKELREELEFMDSNGKIKEFLISNPQNGKYSRDDSKVEDFTGSTQEIDVRKVHDKLLECLRPPGEPLLTVDLSSAQPTPLNAIQDSLELERQAALRKCTIWLVICFNGLEVCRTRSQPLSSCFTASFNERLSLNIVQCPESISVNIHFSDRLLTTIYVPIPGSGFTLETAGVEAYEFSYDRVFPGGGSKHCGVGAGHSFKLLPGDTSSVCFFTSGTLMCRTGWGVFDNTILAPPIKHLNAPVLNLRKAVQSIVSNISDVERLRKWTNLSNLDPNDPNNAEFYELLKNMEGEPANEKKGLILNELEQLYNFCSDEELINTRLRLLMLRNNEELEFKHLRFIPLKEREIPKDIFKDYETRILRGDLLTEVSTSNAIDAYRQRTVHQLNKLKAAVLEKISLAAQNRTLLHMVNEDQVPDMGTLGLTFMKWLQPKRPLRPRRKELKKIPAQGFYGQEIKIIVNIIRAFEIPIRKDVDTLIDDKFSLVPVRPFVEIIFQNKRLRTTTAEGSNPTWNQDLIISLKTNNIDLSMLNETIYIHLFDEVSVDLLEDDRLKETNIHQRFEKHWLGSLSIPFSTLYHNSRIEGTFQLYSPPCLLGYERLTSAHSRNATFLTLFIMLQPSVNPSPPIKQQLESYESCEVEKYLENYRVNMLKYFPKRVFKTLIINTNCKSVCITRYFKPLAFPNLIPESDDISEVMLARYVSMIPTSQTNIFQTSLDVWLTGDQIIGLLSGTNYDHAVLLCCYLMKLKLKVWLIIGSGIPHGPSAYVFVREFDSSCHIWDPVNGLKYDIADSFSPLQSVYCLVNDQNIWINIQKQENVCRMRWDVSKTTDWNPVFGHSMSAPVGSIQPQVIDYSITPLREVLSLQEKIETLLRDAIMKWRTTHRTIWNRYCTATLRKLLPSLEEASRMGFAHKHLSSVDLVQELQHVLASHKMCGFPINLAYTNVNNLIEAVKATGVHTNESDNVEFSLAVYIHPYPAHVLSVWIYVACLFGRR